MTEIQKKISEALLNCSLRPFTREKRFIKQLPNWYKRPMTEKGSLFLIQLFHRYKRQIKNYEEICFELNPEDFIVEENLFGIKILKRKNI